jgi:hypothetical protein
MERASIILEVISFFFVTIELYGPERLMNLRVRIDRSFRSGWEMIPGPRALITGLFVANKWLSIGFIVFILGASTIMGIANTRSLDLLMSSLILAWTFGVFMIILFGLMVAVIVPFVTYYMLMPVILILRLGLWLSRREGAFQGRLLLLGSAIFVVSKGLALAA